MIICVLKIRMAKYSNSRDLLITGSEEETSDDFMEGSDAGKAKDLCDYF